MIRGFLSSLLGFRRHDPPSLAPLCYPIIVAVWSVLGLAVANMGAGIGLRQLVGPLVFSVLVAAIAWLASRSFTSDPHRRGALTLCVVVLFLFGQYILRLLGPVLDLIPGTFPSAGLMALVMALGVATWIVRSRRNIAPVTHFLNASAAALLGITGLQALIGTLQASHREVEDELQPVSARSGAAPSTEDPDIFLILLDAYSGPTSLSRVYDLDISDFISELEDLGFVVPRASRANYVTTFQALAAMMDWEYLDDVAVTTGRRPPDRSVVFRRLHQNATTRFLRERGYRIVFFRSSFPPMNSSPVADVHIPRSLPTAFERRWVETTVLPALVQSVCEFANCAGLGFHPDAPDSHAFRFEEIASLEPSDQPTLVIAHILLPHEPFIFDSDCSHLPPLLPVTVDTSNEREVRERYAAQVLCLNRMLSRLVHRLVSERISAPVVLLQSDHGYGRLGGAWTHALSDADADRVEERLDIFAAYYAPGGAIPEIYDSITPVNAFRAVFRYLFELDLPPLPDRSHWSTYEELFRFEVVP